MSPGSNHSLSVSNNAVIFGTLDTNIVNSNILTVSILNNDYVNSAFAAAEYNIFIFCFWFCRANSAYDQANSAASFANVPLLELIQFMLMRIQVIL
jgi:hypothetical protein